MPNVPGSSTVPLRATAAAGSAAAGHRANRVRTRVRTRPPHAQQAAAQQPPVEEGPPSFALSSDEDIQKFRDSIAARFQPQKTSTAQGIAPQKSPIGSTSGLKHDCLN